MPSFAAPAAAISADAVQTDAADVALTTLTLSHTTPAGTDRVLVVLASYDDTIDIGVLNATYGGAGLTCSLVSEAGGLATEMCVQANPAVGTSDLDLTWTASVTERVVTVLSLSGVDTSDPIGATTTANGTSATAAATLTTAGNDAWAIASLVAADAGTTATPHGASTEFQNDAAGIGALGLVGASARRDAPTSGPYAMGWNLSSSQAWNLLAFEVRPVPAVVELATAASNATEDPVIFDVPVTVSRASNVTISVDYSITGGTATAFVDHTFASGTLDIPPGNTTANIEVPLLEDAIDEANETIEITIASPVGGVLGNTTTHVLTILDDDANNPPSIVDDSDTVPEDGSVVIDVLANDVDVDSDPISIDAVGTPGNGTAVANPNGTITYTPDPDFNGGDSFTYNATDGVLGGQATVSVTVSAVNDAPVASNDTASVLEDGSVVIDVLGNDTDVELDALVLDSVGAAGNGTVVANPNGTVTYTPDADFSGVDQFTYTVSDGVLTANATVDVTVVALNDPPAPVDDALGTVEDVAVIVDVLANDVDVDGDGLTIGGVSVPANGTAVANPNGTVTYTPDADWSGVDTFTYTVTDGLIPVNATVTITVAAANDAPVPLDDAAAVDEDGSVVVAVLDNDGDVDGDSLSIDAVGTPGNGTAVANPNGTVTYTPDPDFSGVDQFTYTVSDGALTANATVDVTVVALNDPPAPVDDALGTVEDVAVIVDVLANDVDVDGDGLTIGGVSVPANGTAVANPNGTITYTPDADWSGVDTFTYTVTDGLVPVNATVTITVAAANDAPVPLDDAASLDEDGSVVVAVLDNDGDVDGDSLSIDAVGTPGNGTAVANPNGTITYTPDADWSGVDAFTYTVTDGVELVVATVTVTVAPVNDAPVAVDDAASVDEDGSVVVTVLANDADVDGDALAVAAVGAPGSGTATANPNGTITYAPDPNANGVDSFTYTLSDGLVNVTATVNVTVAAVNDAPTAAADAAIVAEDGAVTLDVTANDADVDGDALAVASVGTAARGTVVLNANGTITYTPDADAAGADAFAYTVTDGVVGVNATVSVTITAVNDAPVATDDAAATDEGVPVVIDVLANDADVDGDVLAIVSVGAPANGVAVVANGTVTYTPNDGHVGADAFTYTVTDGAVNVTATVNVTTAARAPIASLELGSGPGGYVLTGADAGGDNLTNDAVADADTLLLTGLRAADIANVTTVTIGADVPDNVTVELDLSAGLGVDGAGRPSVTLGPGGLWVNRTLGDGSVLTWRLSPNTTLNSTAAWDGRLVIPTVATTDAFAPGALPVPNSWVMAVVRLGHPGDDPLALSPPAQLVMPGPSSHRVAVSQNGTDVETITALCADGQPPALAPGGACRVGTADDPSVWTTHLSFYVRYRTGGGGGGGSVPESSVDDAGSADAAAPTDVDEQEAAPDLRVDATPDETDDATGDADAPTLGDGSAGGDEPPGAADGPAPDEGNDDGDAGDDEEVQGTSGPRPFVVAIALASAGVVAAGGFVAWRLVRGRE